MGGNEERVSGEAAKTSRKRVANVHNNTPPSGDLPEKACAQSCGRIRRAPLSSVSGSGVNKGKFLDLKANLIKCFFAVLCLLRLFFASCSGYVTTNRMMDLPKSSEFRCRWLSLRAGSGRSDMSPLVLPDTFLPFSSTSASIWCRCRYAGCSVLYFLLSILRNLLVDRTA